MTVFLASLFLPNTIHFQVEQKKTGPTFLTSVPRHPSQIRIGDYGTVSSPVSLFSQDMPKRPNNLDTPAITPPTSSDRQDFFNFKEEPKTPLYGNPAALASLRSIAPSEPHSPAWGRTAFFNQPKSRAEELPPSSILMHSGGHNPRVGRPPTLVIPDTRESSHERALKAAEWSVQPTEQGNSGLRAAVHAACQADSTLEKTWVGTLGMPTDALDEERKQEIESKLEDEHDSLVVFPADSDFDGHYAHYCKTMLWPVFHYQIPDNPKSKAYQDHSWKYYVKVNQAFADRIVKSYKKGDVIWIHDYHLLLLPSMIRQKLPDAEIGFFLHVAFPSSEVFRCLAMRNQLLEGLLGANLIGFQTQEYCMHFLQTCNRLLCVEATPNGVQLEERFVNIATFPMGVDLDDLDLRREDAGVLDWVKRMQTKYPEKHLIVARDKLDHVRGVRQKLLSYELFLNKYPEYREKVVLIQVATSTTEQAELDAAVSDIVTRINSQHSTLAHQPLVFLKQDMEYSQYLAMLTSADALMITSLREGMNLTSHEFLLCQDGKHAAKKHGSLILSEFTGSASLFNNQELSVNPWDYRQCAEAIRKTIEMSASEKAQRWENLMGAVKHYNASHWYKAYLKQLHDAWSQHSRQHTVSIPRLSFGSLSAQYKAASSRLFMLDYEGTLATRESPKTMMFNSPQRTIDALNDLISAPGNIVYVMSGKRPEELDMLFQRVPGLGMIAENGCFLKDFDSDAWHEVADLERMARWKDSIMSVLEYYQDRVEGSCIEERHCSVIFHYKDAKDATAAARQAGDCANHINESCQNLKVQAVPVDGAALVIEPTEWSKGTAAARIFEGLKRRIDVQNSDQNSAGQSVAAQDTAAVVGEASTSKTGTSQPASANAVTSNAATGGAVTSEAAANESDNTNPGTTHLPAGHADSTHCTKAIAGSHATNLNDAETTAEIVTAESTSTGSSALTKEAVPAGEPVADPSAETKTSAPATPTKTAAPAGAPQFLMVAGDSREDEGIYRWANKLGEDGVVRDVTTVSVSSRNTEAMATLSQGVTGVLLTLHKLAALQ